MLRYLNVKSRQRSELVDITERVQEVLAEAGAKSGICYVFVPHTTAGITVNEGADPSVQVDILMGLERLVPRDAGYQHQEGNSDAHIKSTMTGSSLYLPYDEGRLVLGTWQSVFFCEFDGPRHRRVGLSLMENA